MDLDEFELRMMAALDAVGREFDAVRTGKAVPSLLENVKVNAYGGTMPLQQLATIGAPDASLLVVQPFDASTASAIEKAILSSGLGLNPSTDGAVVRVPIPALTQERRLEYVKALKRMAEEGRISVRRARQAGNEGIRGAIKEKEMGEDEARRLQEALQKLTDDFIQRIDRMLESKRKEVMAI